MKSTLPPLINLFNTHRLLLVTLLVLVTAYFGPLFYPQPQIIITPDFIQSDNTHFNLPLKLALSQALDQGTLPFWESRLGTGVPLVAESQVGAFQPINLVLFGLLPLVTAWNLYLVCSFVIMYFGTYYLARRVELASNVAVVVAATYTFSGFFIAHLMHANHLQAMSFTPWLIALYGQIATKPRLKFVSLAGLTTGLTILVGQFQFFFISMVGALVYSGFLWYQTAKPKLKSHITKIIFWFLALSLGLGLAVIQLGPSFELYQRSLIQTKLDANYQFEFPFRFSNLQTFINPFFAGNPANGTYPPHVTNQWGSFWENTTYLGVLGLILAAWGIKNYQQSSTQLKAIGVMGLVGLILTLGDSTPLGLIHQLPGFDSFRVPGRFLLLLTLGLSLWIGYGVSLLLAKVKSPQAKYWLPLVCLIIIQIDIFYYFGRLHGLVSAETYFSPPAITNNLPTDARIATHLNHFLSWQETVFKRGWQQIEDFEYFRNGLSANSNLLYDINHVHVYAGLIDKRQDLNQGLYSKPLLSLAGITHIISPDEIDDPDLDLVDILNPPRSNLPNYYLYRYTQNWPLIRLANQYQSIASFEEGKNKLASLESLAGYVDLVEGNPLMQLDSSATGSARVIYRDQTSVQIETEATGPMLLILTESYDPHWSASINQEVTTIYPTNLNQRGIFVPGGKSQVELKYTTRLIYNSSLVSFLSLIGLALGLIPQIQLKLKRITNHLLKP